VCAEIDRIESSQLVGDVFGRSSTGPKVVSGSPREGLELEPAVSQRLDLMEDANTGSDHFWTDVVAWDKRHSICLHATLNWAATS
jgi:hypothetical protein